MSEPTEIFDLNVLLTIIIFPYIILIVKFFIKPIEKRLERMEKLLWRENVLQRNGVKSERLNRPKEKDG